MRPENAFAFRPEGAPDSWPKKSQRNEAAERLRAMAPIDPYAPAWQAEMDRLLDEALAAERRATVERIREAIERAHHSTIANVRSVESLHRILDEEAAR